MLGGFPEDAPGFVTRVELVRERIPDASVYPFNIAAFEGFRSLALHPKVTYLVGENGSGKSTLLEAIAVAAGFNAEGGSVNFNFRTRSSESSLHTTLRLVRSTRRPQTGFFLRAESFFNVATHIEELDREDGLSPPLIGSYGGRSLHEQSHGESFMSLVRHRFGRSGLYVLDEPESALSPARQLDFLSKMHDLIEDGSQFIISTHAPIVLAYPDAYIYELLPEERTIRARTYDETSTVGTTVRFLRDPEAHLRVLRRPRR